MVYGVTLAGIRMRLGNADLQIGTYCRASGNVWERLSTERLGHLAAYRRNGRLLPRRITGSVGTAQALPDFSIDP
jgi:hypothetical protein